MIYILYGNDDYKRQQYLKGLLNDIDINSINRFDGNENDLDAIIDFCSTSSLLSDKQAIIINNFEILNYVEDLKKLESYLKNPNPSTLFIMNFSLEKLDNRKKVVKLLKKHGQVNCFEKNQNTTDFAKNLLLNYQISEQDLNYFLKLTGNNLGIIENEILKLKSYLNGEKTINKKIIDQVCSPYQSPDLFALIDAIVNQNIQLALKLYHVLLTYNEEPIKINVMVANQLRLLYQVKKLLETGYDESVIAQKLAVHPYRVKLARTKTHLYNEKTLLKLLNKLADIDIAIKSGTIKKELAFEFFILELEGLENY